MNEKEWNIKYEQSAASSFNTKLEMYLFDQVNNQKFNEHKFEEFDCFEITENVVKEYVASWQIKYKSDEYNERIKPIDDKIEIIYKENKAEIDKLKKDYINLRFRKIFAQKDFIDLQNEKKCFYCKITEDNIKDLIAKKQLYKKHISRVWTFEIDRRKPNFEYDKKNCVLCCYWCNNAKTDEFDDTEFIPDSALDY